MSRSFWLSHALFSVCVLMTTTVPAFAKDEPPCEPNLANPTASAAAAAVPTAIAANLTPLAKKAALSAFETAMRSVLRYAKGTAVRASEARAVGDYVFTVTVNFSYSKEGGDLHSQDFDIRVLGSGQTELLTAYDVQHSQVTPKVPVEKIEDAAMQYVHGAQLGTLLDIHVLAMNASDDLPKDYRVRMKVKKPNGFNTEIIKIGRLHAGGAVSILDL